LKNESCRKKTQGVCSLSSKYFTENRKASLRDKGKNRASQKQNSEWLAAIQKNTACSKPDAKKKKAKKCLHSQDWGGGGAQRNNPLEEKGKKRPLR